MNGDQIDEEQMNPNLETHHPWMELPRYLSAELFVADLHPSAEEHAGSLYELFSQVGTVTSVKVMRPLDSAGKLPHCSAYINFLTVEDACRAWQIFNYHSWMGVPMRIMFSNLDPATRYNERANIIVMNLAGSIDSETLHHTFCIFGVVLSCKVDLDLSGKSTGLGFIQFQDQEDAERAIQLVNNKMLEDKIVSVRRFMRRTFSPEREDQVPKNKIMHMNQANGLNRKHFNLNIPPELVAPIGSPDLGEGVDVVPTATKSRSLGEVAEVVSSTTKAEQDFRSGRESIADENTARRRGILEKRLKEILETGADNSEADSQLLDKVDPAQFPRSEPRPPQPWSVATLEDMLGKARLPQERRAIIGETFFHLVAKNTDSLAAEITNKLVDMGLEEAVRVMRLSEDEMYNRVEEVKQGIRAGIEAQAPFVPATKQAVAEASVPVSTMRESTEQQTVAVAAIDPTMASFLLPPKTRGPPSFPDSVRRPAFSTGLGTGFFEPFTPGSGTGFFQPLNFRIRRALAIQKLHTGSRNVATMQSKPVSKSSLQSGVSKVVGKAKLPKRRRGSRGAAKNPFAFAS